MSDVRQSMPLEDQLQTLLEKMDSANTHLSGGYKKISEIFLYTHFHNFTYNHVHTFCMFRSKNRLHHLLAEFITLYSLLSINSLVL